MKYRPLGRTGLSVSEISLGFSGFWGNRLFSERKALQIVHEAFVAGVNMFDTGHNYSNYNAEPRLGRALKEILSTHDRSRVVISSKAGTVRPIRFQFQKAKNQNFSPDYIEEAVAASVRNLGCGYLDIFYLHGLTWSQLTDELLSRLAAMKQNGMFRHLGLNTHHEDDMILACENPGIFDVLLIDASVLQLHRFPIIEKLRQAGIGVIAGTVLGQGHLIEGKIGRIRNLADVWYLARAMLKPAGKRLAQNSKEMRKVLANVHGMTAAQAAVAYILQSHDVSSCVFGTTQVDNLQDVVGASGKRLSEATNAAVGRAYDKLTMHIGR